MPLSDELMAVMDAYDTARKRLAEMAPCPKCCPPRRPCSPGEYIAGCDIRRCGKCGGDGFFINWDDEEEVE
jgi:hypothetical protein